MKALVALCGITLIVAVSAGFILDVVTPGLIVCWLISAFFFGYNVAFLVVENGYDY